VPTGTATATTTPTATETLGVPTGTATAASSAPAGSATEDPCAEFDGAGFWLCSAYCGLDCVENPRRSCGLIERAFKLVTDESPPSCETPDASDPCSDFTGRAARLCHRLCERCAGAEPSKSCQRLQRHFTRIAGAPVQCGG
jgi:hypothetical protein